MVLPKITFTSIFAISITLCAGCGGGSNNNGSAPISSSTPPQQEEPKSDFESGTFQNFNRFEQLCETPRQGSDSQGRPFPDSQGSTQDENNWLRSWSHDLYLWYDEITDVDPESLSTPEYFEEMKTFELTESGNPKDKFHFAIPTDEWIALSQGGIQGGYGAEFKILNGAPPRKVLVAYTEPDTPATAEAINLKRGAEILEIDGVDVINGDDIDTLNNGLFPDAGETHTFLIKNVEEDSSRSITMTSTEIVSTPVQNLSFLETDNGVVGYFTFNSHIAPAEKQLIEAVTQLRESNISDLVVDLRYNGGGFLDIANELSAMIAGDSAVGQVFEAIEFNEKHPDLNPVTGELLTPKDFLTTSQGFSAPEGAPLPALGLDRVFIITGSGTCSASESIINGLRGIDMEVIVIGNTTCGKPYGFYAFDNCGTTYFSIQFRGVNQKGFGDYADGFSPSNLTSPEGVPISGCLVSDDFNHELGDPQEGRLKAALAYRNNATCPTLVNQASTGETVKMLMNENGDTAIQNRMIWSQNRILNRSR